jgi:hypothetical protein
MRHLRKNKNNKNTKQNEERAVKLDLNWRGQRAAGRHRFDRASDIYAPLSVLYSARTQLKLDLGSCHIAGLKVECSDEDGNQA